MGRQRVAMVFVTHAEHEVLLVRRSARALPPSCAGPRALAADHEYRFDPFVAGAFAWVAGGAPPERVAAVRPCRARLVNAARAAVRPSRDVLDEMHRAARAAARDLGA